MKLTVFFGLMALFAIIFSAEAGRKYQFIPAKCVEHDTQKQVDGPLKICTFPPKHKPVPQEDINAVIKHIQTLQLD
ncbi:uncharacterized protein LOC111689973 [Lucilia cuprina]|uniref:uncharacterized protein LOC111689973 n=1 Tax=Lucilia cuprina TaxID=7375 RepID=UPI001F0690ED|nr:uncharacterized protein LOC111689973 [Lucilia cuprina]